VGGHGCSPGVRGYGITWQDRAGLGFLLLLLRNIWECLFWQNQRAELSRSVIPIVMIVVVALSRTKNPDSLIDRSANRRGSCYSLYV
jgi:hypothetical protein